MAKLKVVRNKHNTPGIIKYPFWRMTAENPKAVYACVNLGEAWAPERIQGRSICIDGDIGEILCITKKGAYAPVFGIEDS